ncbi:flippase [Pseudoalteromonas spongiae]|uniref:flippase n=1 Tax=Pseudoalteromonas spongiae TaxID=298657 RepID=UPI00026CDA98|nr:flippase [Pseudoalteromonas spongiae]ATC97629.1 hypothetical protein PSPO_a0406 [Pseudoalteromonas spongiae UST010723-006]
MSDLKKSITNTILLFCEKWLLLALNFITVILLTRYLDIKLVGTYSSILAFASLLLPFTTLGLNNLASKYFIKYPNSKHFYFCAALRIRLFGAIFAALVGIVLGFFVYGISYELQLVSILLFFQMFNIFNLVEYLFMSQQQVWKTMPYRVAIRITIKFMFLIALIYKCSLTSLIFILGSEYLLIALAYWLIYTNNNIDQEQNFRTTYTPTIKRFFHKSKWLFLSSFAMILYLKIDQVMLSQMIGMEQTAQYAVAAKLSEFWYIFPVLLANAFNPLLTNNYTKQRATYDKHCKLLLSALFLSAIVIASTTALVAEPLIEFLFGESYKQSASILTIHIWACIFVFQRAIFSKWLILSNNYKYSLWTHFLGATINILLNLLLIPIFGGIGAAVASVASYTFAGFISLFIFRQTRPFAYLMTAAMINCVPNCISLLSIKNKPYA